MSAMHTLPRIQPAAHRALVEEADSRGSDRGAGYARKFGWRYSRYALIALLAWLLCALAAPAAQAADNTLYGSFPYTPFNIYTINPTNGAATQVGTLAFVSAAIARDPLTGQVFYTEYKFNATSPPYRIAAWDPTTGTNTILPNTLGIETVRLAFRADGVLFVMDPANNNLYTINTVSGASTLVGTVTGGGLTTGGSGGDIAFSPTGQLYLVNGSNLYTITGTTASLAGGTGIVATRPLTGIAFAYGGALYGSDYNTASPFDSNIYTLGLAGGNTLLGASGTTIFDLGALPKFANLAITKTDSPDPAAAGSALTYTIVVTNNGPQSATNVVMSDPLPAGTLFQSVTPQAGFTCTTPAVGANGTVSCTNGAAGILANGATATFTIVVTAPSSPGTISNTATASSDTFDQTPANNSATASTTITPRPPVLTKSFDAPTIPVNGVVTMRFTITNPNNQTLNDVTFNDIYPTGLVNAATPNVTSNCDVPNAAGGNDVTGGVAGGNTIGLGANPGTNENDMPANSTCTVTVNVTSATAGSYVNITTTPVDSSDSAAGLNSSATLVVLARPQISKNFAPDPVIVNGVSTLIITLTNPNAGAAITGAAFTDTYPAAIDNSSSPGATTTCGGTVTAAASGPSVALTGGVIPAGGSCTVSVNVTSSTAGTHTNTIAAGALTTSNAGTNAVAASDTLTVGLALAIVKSSTAFSDPSNGTTNPKRIPGGFVNYTLVVSNPGAVPIDLNSVVITDPIPGNTELFVNSLGCDAVAFTAGSSGLTCAPANVDFSSDNGLNYVQTVLPDANGVNASVTHVRIKPQGTFAAGSNFTLVFRVRIK